MTESVEDEIYLTLRSEDAYHHQSAKLSSLHWDFLRELRFDINKCYRLALTQFNLCNNFMTITSADEAQIKIFIKRKPRVITVPAARCATRASLCKHVLDVLPVGFLELNCDNPMLEMTLLKSGTKIEFMTKNLARQLGFEEHWEYKYLGGAVHIGDTACDPFYGFHNLYLHCSMVKESMLGSKMQRLLSVIPVKESDSSVYFEIKNLQFAQIAQVSPRGLDLHIMNEHAQLLEFGTQWDQSFVIVLILKMQPSFFL